MKKKVTIELFGNIEKAVYLSADDLLNRNVRYLGTDYEISGFDIYEEVYTGDLYATKL